MSNFQEEISTQLKKLRGQVETFVSEKVSPTLDKATTRLKATVDTTSRLDDLIALLVSKGIITEEELKATEKAREHTRSQAVQDMPKAAQPPAQDRV
jgi:polyhydroxyalkanoate synthesis regulator phasin